MASRQGDNFDCGQDGVAQAAAAADEDEDAPVAFEDGSDEEDGAEHEQVSAKPRNQRELLGTTTLLDSRSPHVSLFSYACDCSAARRGTTAAHSPLAFSQG